MRPFATISANVQAPTFFKAADVEAAIRYSLHPRSLHEDVSVRPLPTEGAFSVRIRYSLAGGTAEVRDAAARLSRITALTVDAVRIDGRPVPEPTSFYLLVERGPAATYLWEVPEAEVDRLAALFPSAIYLEAAPGLGAR